jgi:hypothetical protein
MIPFAPYLPDLAAFETLASFQALNVVPSSTGFLPFAGLSAISNATTNRVQGAFSVRSVSGTVHNFCGDSTKLYKLSADGLTWNDVSRTVGGAYATAADGWWDFSVFGDRVFVSNNVDTTQTFQLDVSTNFTALSGTPPTSTFTGTIRDFAVLARQNTLTNRLRWSAINNVADWVASSATMSDFQDFPDGGSIMGFVGGEYGVVFLERAIYRMPFEGPPTIFRFDRIANTIGCRVERSIASYQNMTFFLSNDGFYMLQGGSVLVPIGAEKIDRTFETLFNANYPYLCSAAIDPTRKLYLFSFPSNASSSMADTILAYHWPTGQFSLINASVDMIYTALTQSSFTLDSIDSVSTNLDALPFSLDSRYWSGVGRLLLSGFDSSHKQGFFNGTNLAATIETGDAQLSQGRLSLLKAARPMIEGLNATPTVTIKSRNRLQDSYSSATPVAANANGVCPLRVNARYHRMIMTVPAASDWTFARGVDDIKFTATGAR